MLLTKVRHEWPEPKGFELIRPRGYPEYTFLHFLTPITLSVSGETIAVQPGGCILFPPGTAQHFSAATPLVHNWLHASSELSVLLSKFNIPLGQVFYPRDPNFITEYFRKMELEFFSDLPYKEILLDGYLQEFFILLQRSLESSAVTAPIKNTERLQIREMRHKILSTPYRKWTVGQLAELVALSPSRFYAVYKAMFGISPLQDLIEARIEYSKNLLLRYKSLSLTQIAEKAGYNDQFHFIRQFRNQTGMTPGQYRKENRQ